MRNYRVARFALLALILAAAGCADASGPQAAFPDKLERLSPDNLVGEPGFTLADPVAVRVLDTQGRGVAGQTVEFTVTAGAGSVSPARALTDSAGVARAEWRLGSEAGNNELRAGVPGSSFQPVTFRAVSREGPGGTLLKVSGGGTALLPGGCPVQQPLVVRVVDGTGKPVSGASVEFVVDAGGGTATPDVVKTGANGEATTTWRVGLEGGANSVRAVLRTSARPSVGFTAESVPMAPGGFATIGNKIYNSNCATHLFHGVARPALQWSPGGDDRFVNVAQDFALIKSWKANVVRIPITQVFWTPGVKLYDPTYKARVLDTVKKARDLGLTVILDLHASDRGNAAYDTVPDVQQLPDEKHSLPFWRDLANTFKGDGGVVFELYNEPHDITWDMWLNGGDIPTGPAWAGGPVRHGYKAVGMQQLYDAVRAAGARNLVIVSGMHWGYFLDEVPNYRVKGYNIAYASHPYDWPDKQPESWDEAFGSLAATDPVIISEFGAYKCDRTAYYTAAMDYADRKGMSWIAWAWWTPPATMSPAERSAAICNFPALITDWNGTPSASGALVKARLATY